MRDELWLLCYEAGVRGWGGFNDAHIKVDSYFNELHKLDVRFYDSDATTRLLFRIKAGTLEKFNLMDFETFFERDDAEDFLEYEEGDGGYEGVIFDEDEPAKLTNGDDVDDVDEEAYL